MVAQPKCPRCGTALRAEILQGLCPKCVGRGVRGDTPESRPVDAGEDSMLNAAERTEIELARLKPDEVGERIGPYKLLEQIGEGGFGTVWIAEQKEPVRRRVALKILKLGMDTKEVLARFEQERQAL